MTASPSTVSAMPAAETFTCFMSLPAELRFQIWKEVIESPSIWCIRYHNPRELSWPPTEDSHLIVPPGRASRYDAYRAKCITQGPCKVNLVCREARQMVDEVMKKRRGRGDPVMILDVPWLDLDRTIFDLGNIRQTNGLCGWLQGRRSEFRDGLRYVVVHWDGYMPFGQCFFLLEAMKVCKNLRGIIIQLIPSFWVDDGMHMVLEMEPPMYGKFPKPVDCALATSYFRIFDGFAPQVSGCLDETASYIQRTITINEGGQWSNPPRMIFTGPDLEPAPSF